MKSRGGRGHSVNYKTVTMRIPQPIQAEVIRLQEEFYANYVEPQPIHKEITDLSPVEDLGFSRELTLKLQRCQISKVEDLVKMYYSGELKSASNLGRVSLKQIEEKLASLEDKGVTGIESKSVTGKISDDSPIEKLKLPKNNCQWFKKIHKVNTVGDLKTLLTPIPEEFDRLIVNLRMRDKKTIRLIDKYLSKQPRAEGW